MGYSTESKWLTATITFALAALSASTAFSLYFWKRKSRDLDSKIGELEKSLKASLDNCAAERQGRIRAQQALRKALTQPKLDNVELTSYPMAPIGVIQSCFSTRNGTPRQPVLVPLSRACLIFNTARVPPASLEGLGEYSHCWVIYVFHKNTNLEKLWKDPTKSKFKAKVRVPTLNGERKGLFATRSPHRPSPIGLSVAKVEAVQGHMLLLSGVDLVDGTPVLDVKPYIPYCDSIQGARVPKWLAADSILAVASVSFSEVFTSTLADCWEMAGNNSLYASPDEFQNLIKQVLSWDIRSLAQRNRPHDSFINSENGKQLNDSSDNDHDEEASSPGNGQPPSSSGDIMYHLTLEGLEVSYRLNSDFSVVVEKVKEVSNITNSRQKRCNYSMWRV
ncbi:hypothetical protein CerSpe_009530 [Prunus speciosa]